MTRVESCFQGSTKLTNKDTIIVINHAIPKYSYWFTDENQFVLLPICISYWCFFAILVSSFISNCNTEERLNTM